MIVIYVPRCQGGVRNVTLSLAESIRSKGIDVFTVHDHYSLLSFSIRYFFATRRRPSAILSLSSGIFAPLFERSVYILHGFPVKPLYGFFRAESLKVCARLASLSGAKTSAVSYLTKNIFQRIYGIHVDFVIPNGVSSHFHSAPSPSLPKAKRVLYLGRLSSNKGVLELAAAFFSSSLPSKGYQLWIAGSGPLGGRLAELASSSGSVVYLGEVDEDVKMNLYLDSEIFVSLNDFEPFGVTAIEASFACCKTILAYGTGIADHFPMGGVLIKCDPQSKRSVAGALEAAVELGFPAPLDPLQKLVYDYSFIASKYLAILDP